MLQLKPPSHQNRPHCTERCEILTVFVKSFQSLSSFKSHIPGRLAAPVVPKYFFVGQHKLSVIHTRIRNKYSNLKYDLFSDHICSDCACSCEYAIEDAKHYFFQCTRYINARQLFFFLSSSLLSYLIEDLLLFGSENLSSKHNSTIFSKPCNPTSKLQIDLHKRLVANKSFYYSCFLSLSSISLT